MAAIMAALPVGRTSVQCSSFPCDTSGSLPPKSLSSVSFQPKSGAQTKLSCSIFGSPVVVKKDAPAVRSSPMICLAAYAEGEIEETEEEITAAYEALYGRAFANLGDNKKNSSLSDDDEEEPIRVRRGKKPDGDFTQRDKRSTRDAFEEQVIQVRRVTKVVKGGKQLSFRAVVVIGDRNGTVGVGVGKAKEVVVAVQKSAADARRHLVAVPMTKYLTFPHRAEGTSGAAKVMLRPAAPGTGVIAGGAVRVVLELAGVENALGKELGSGNPLNNARAVLDAVGGMKQLRDVAKARGIPMEELWK